MKPQDDDYLILATPDWIAAFATASATLAPTRGSKALGKIYSSHSSPSSTSDAIASDAAIFISSLIQLALTSKAPLKIPGNASTLMNYPAAETAG
jgi:hypothetical protein